MRNKLLDAAVELIARDGIQAVSHRSVEELAGASHGSTTYYFKTRDAFLSEVLRHLAGQDQQAMQAVLGGRDLASLADDASIMEVIGGELIEFLTGSRQQTLARYELFLYAARRPELRGEVARWRGFFVHLVEPLLARLGAGDPPLAARWFMASLDGILMDQIVNPDPAFAERAPRYLSALLEVAARDSG